MVEPRNHIKNFDRYGQPYKTRLDRVRLGFNEYVPHIDRMLIEKILEDLSIESFSAYPEINTAYEILATYLGKDIENIILGHGSDGVIFTILNAYCDPGDTICTLTPTYGMYEVYSLMLDCKFKEVPYTHDRTVNLDQLLNTLDQKPKVFILANPNGVIGTSLKYKDIDLIIEVAKKNNTLVIIDEAYSEFSKNTMIDLTDKYKNLIVVRSFSKSMGMAGLRIGYGIMDRSIRHNVYKMKPVVELNTVAVSAIKVLCEDKSILKKLVSDINISKRYVYDVLTKAGLEVLDTETNFLLINFKENSKNILKQLDRYNIEIKKLEGNFSGYYRVTIGNLNIMKNFIDLVKNSICEESLV